MAADGTKQPCTPEKPKDKEQASLVAGEKEGGNEGGEGPSVEVKEEESKDGAEVTTSKEKPNTMETTADSKPPGDKYSPKVSLRISWCCNVLLYEPRYAQQPANVFFLTQYSHVFCWCCQLGSCF